MLQSSAVTDAGLSMFSAAKYMREMLDIAHIGLQRIGGNTFLNFLNNPESLSKMPTSVFPPLNFES